MKRNPLWTLILGFCFIVQPFLSHAADAPLTLPRLTTSTDAALVTVKGLRFNAKNPFHLDFIIDADPTAISQETLRGETLRLVRYFLAALTVPNDQWWVNLSPYEKNRIVPESLGQTEMGRDLLSQDCVLKQITSSLMNPSTALGKAYWQRIYQALKEKSGTTARTIAAFNKVWIVPEKATIQETGNTAVVTGARLKVMLDEDYLALKNNLHAPGHASVSSAVRTVILPEIEKEVNTAQAFARVRQINEALILAAWFKRTLRASILGQVYANQNKVDGIDLADKQAKQRIYNQYLAALKRGTYNFIKEETDPQTQQLVAHKYFAGGYDGTQTLFDAQQISAPELDKALSASHAMIAPVDLAVLADKAVVAQEDALNRLSAIKADHYQGFPVIDGHKDIPVGIKYALAFYDIKDSAHNPLREIIRAGHLRAGPDHQGQLKGIRDGDMLLVSTDEENNVEESLIRLLNPEGQAADALVGEFNAWKKKIRSSAIRSLAIHTSSVIAKPMEVLQRYGIVDLLTSGRPLSMQAIVDHVKALTVDGQQIKFNTPNPQYIFSTMRALASLGWLTQSGASASNEMTFTLTPQGAEAMSMAGSYAKVADFMPAFPRLADYIFRRAQAPALPTGALSLEQLADLSRRGWETPAGMESSVASLVKGQLDGYLVINLALALFYQEHLFDLFNDQLTISLDDVIREKNVQGDPKELKAVFDIFTNVGFFVDQGQGRYRLSTEGLVALDRVLAYGVPVSYRPSYDLSEEFMFGDAKQIKRYDDHGRELLVYRYLNVLGSGASHATYFKQVDKIVQQMIAKRLASGEIPASDQINPQAPFVLSFADTGAGDGTFLAHIHHVIMNETGYGQLVRANPDLYKVEMIGLDFNAEAQFAASENLFRQGIEHTVMFGNINDPKQIVHDVAVKLKEKYGERARTMVVHTRTFLDHNRPWKDIENKEQAAKRISTSTGSYGWRGQAIANNLVEQNLYEHFKAWADALRAAGQEDLINIELHTIPPDIAAANIGKTLDVPYWLSHAYSDQFTIEFSIYEARVKEAGFVPDMQFQKRFPEGALTTVSIDFFSLADHAEDKAMPVGGINLNPDLGVMAVRRFGAAPESSGQAMAGLRVGGMMPVLLTIKPYQGPAALE